MAGWSTARKKLPKAHGWPRRAVELGKDDAVALSRGGHALAWFRP